MVVEDSPAGQRPIRPEAIYDPGCNSASESLLTCCAATDDGGAYEVVVVEVLDQEEWHPDIRRSSPGPAGTSAPAAYPYGAARR